MDGPWPDWTCRIDFSSFQEIPDCQNNLAGIGKADPALGRLQTVSLEAVAQTIVFMRG
jgi:hypothetical protein